MLLNLPGPRLTNTLHLSGSEPKRAPKKMHAFATSASGFLVIVEGRATLFAPQAIDDRIGQQKRENTQ